MQKLKKVEVGHSPLPQPSFPFHPILPYPSTQPLYAHDPKNFQRHQDSPLHSIQLQ